MAAGVAGIAAAGCASSGDPEGGGATATKAAGDDTAPDVAVATTALGAIRSLERAVAATLTKYPATSSSLREVLAMHRAHAAALVDAVPDQAQASADPTPYAVPRSRDRALVVLARREQGLHDSLGGLAMRAQSGDFARLLASMGSAVGQRLALWAT